VSGWVYLANDTHNGRAVLRIIEYAFDGNEGVLRLLNFLGAQRDQYATAWITLPSDFPLNRLLRETQLAHRPVTHAFAESFPFTRMQVRVLDHKRFLEAMHVPERCSGTADITVRETEGTVSRFRLEIDNGHVAVKPSTQTPAVECSDVLWASIATGDLSAKAAARLGLIQAHNLAAIELLESLSDGPVPFCHEYF
jgi:predicted acetyltransferase